MKLDEMSQEDIDQFVRKSISDLKRYEDFKIIEVGKNGLVLGAVNCIENRHVTLKIVAVEDELIDELKNTISLTKLLNCTHVIEIYRLEEIKLGNTSQKYFLIEMEKYDMNLTTFLKLRNEDRKLDSEMKIDICIQIINAVLAIHNQNIIFKNLEPDNILIKIETDKKVQVKIASSELSEELKANTQYFSNVKGNLLYLPIEDEKIKQQSKSTDAYALGIIMLEIDNYQQFKYDFYLYHRDLCNHFEVPFPSSPDINRNSLIYEVAQSIFKFYPKERNDLKNCLQKLLSHQNSQQRNLQNNQLKNSQNNSQNSQAPQIYFHIQEYLIEYQRLEKSQKPCDYSNWIKCGNEYTSIIRYKDLEYDKDLSEIQEEISKISELKGASINYQKGSIWIFITIAIVAVSVGYMINLLNARRRRRNLEEQNTRCEGLNHRWFLIEQRGEFTCTKAVSLLCKGYFNMQSYGKKWICQKSLEERDQERDTDRNRQIDLCKRFVHCEKCHSQSQN